MTVVATARDADIREVCMAMRERDFHEIICTGFERDRLDLAEYYVQMRRLCNRAIFRAVFSDNGAPVCIVIMNEMRPGVWSLGMFAGDDFTPEKGAVLTRWIIKTAIPEYLFGAHRLEACSDARYAEVHKWLQFLGLQDRSYFYNYGRNGETFILFSFNRPPGKGKLIWRGGGGRYQGGLA